MRNFLDALDSPGGHLIISMAMLSFGVGLYVSGQSEIAKELTTIGYTLLARNMIGSAKEFQHPVNNGEPKQ